MIARSRPVWPVKVDTIRGKSEGVKYVRVRRNPTMSGGMVRTTGMIMYCVREDETCRPTVGIKAIRTDILRPFGDTAIECKVGKSPKTLTIFAFGRALRTLLTAS